MENYRFYSVGAGFSPLPADHPSPIEQSVLPVFTRVADQLVPLGTAFMIAPNGLMMTARHVVEAALATKTHRSRDDGTFYDHYELYVLYLTGELSDNPDAVNGGFLSVVRVWCSDNTDIGFCWLQTLLKNDEPVSYPTMRLSPGLPRVGEKILGVGYHKMNTTVAGVFCCKTVVDYSQDFAHASGSVITVHRERRDVGMLNFPCFHTDAQFEPGMSGGPIFDERGYVCGVICSSMPPIENDPRYISYGSLLWIALGSSIEIASPIEERPENVTIYDLVSRGYIRTDESIGDVTVVTRPDGKTQVSLA